jgi:hypothetical protein
LEASWIALRHRGFTAGYLAVKPRYSGELTEACEQLLERICQAPAFEIPTTGAGLRRLKNGWRRIYLIKNP